MPWVTTRNTDAMTVCHLLERDLPPGYEFVRWQETNYQGPLGGLGPLATNLHLPPLAQVEHWPSFVLQPTRQLLPIVDAYGLMIVAPGDATDLWPLLLRLKAALREHLTWGRLVIERKTFVATARYPRPRFDPVQVWAPAEGGEGQDDAAHAG
jgi:hypothetical protein